MRALLSKISALLMFVLLTGCAASYKPIYPPTVLYDSHDMGQGVGLSYKYDVLLEKGNKKLARKEEKNHIKLIAVKLTNNTPGELSVAEDLVFYNADKQLFPMDPESIQSSIKQSVPGYIPYFLLTFLNLSFFSGSSVDSYPVGLVIGPGIAGGNMGMAGSANKKLLAELELYNIMDLRIAGGETVYGIIGFRNLGYSPLTIGVRKTDLAISTRSGTITTP